MKVSHTSGSTDLQKEKTADFILKIAEASLIGAGGYLFIGGNYDIYRILIMMITIIIALVLYVMAII